MAHEFRAWPTPQSSAFVFFVLLLLVVVVVVIMFLSTLPTYLPTYLLTYCFICYGLPALPTPHTYTYIYTRVRMHTSAHAHANRIMHDWCGPRHTVAPGHRVPAHPHTPFGARIIVISKLHSHHELMCTVAPPRAGHLARLAAATAAQVNNQLIRPILQPLQACRPHLVRGGCQSRVQRTHWACAQRVFRLPDDVPRQQPCRLP